MSIFSRVTEKLRKMKKKFAYTLIFLVTVAMGATLVITVRSVISQRRKKVNYIDNE
jgi:FtsH-binding integral membrane protein